MVFLLFALLCQIITWHIHGMYYIIPHDFDDIVRSFLYMDTHTRFKRVPCSLLPHIITTGSRIWMREVLSQTMKGSHHSSFSGFSFSKYRPFSQKFAQGPKCSPWARAALSLCSTFCLGSPHLHTHRLIILLLFHDGKSPIVTSGVHQLWPWPGRLVSTTKQLLKCSNLIIIKSAFWW